MQVIFDAFGNSGDPYYSSTSSSSAAGTLAGPSFEAKVLLPLKTLAYGVACHCFCDYFQMSTTSARVSCKKFHLTLSKCFKKEFLRLPTPADLHSVTTLHQKAHGVNGMIGSLDCMHTYWKNCPVGWQQSFQGKDKGESTVVLEAVADHYLWFWHASYGYGGSLNDINVLQLSPLMKRLTDGTFTETEKESGVAPFDIGEFGSFDQTFMLVDGIYPSWSRFIRGFKEPITVPEARFSTWQEGARKDVERAFGVFQRKWKAIASPIHFIEPTSIGEMVTCCLILHNMGVSDRVMGDVNMRYDPGSVPFTARSITSLHDIDNEVDDDDHCEEVQQGQEDNNLLLLPPVAQEPPPVEPAAVTGIGRMDSTIQLAIIRKKEIDILHNKGEWARLQKALIKYIDSTYRCPAAVDTDDEEWCDVTNQPGGGAVEDDDSSSGGGGVE